ncbi:N-acetylmuramoyl-L-alanine amidase, partial [Escherichia coli]|nr:N-acetylmuramoyl-L-alanine amidase [Escherichia coli]
GHRDPSEDLNGDGTISPDEWIKQCPSFNAISEYKELVYELRKK